ncbi:hypothetical protein Lal_00036739 [Lupinus albus]|nr:hypothetical protein Lal_00036739 [Lupinus albus]
MPLVRTSKRRERRAFQEQGALGLILELEKRDPKVGGGVGRTREVAKNRTPILTKVQALCPKLDRRPNVMHAGEERDHGRMVTPSGAGTSGVDDPARGKRIVTDCKLSHYFRLGRVDPNLFAGGGVDVYVLESGCGKSADRVVAVGDLCKISDHASGMGPMSAKRVRTPLRKRDRCLFSNCHERNVYYSVDMRDDVPVGFNPGNGLASRLSERFSPERERITWDGEILGYTGGFSPERELSRLGEK